jgi:hypothetical protein
MKRNLLTLALTLAFGTLVAFGQSNATPSVPAPNDQNQEQRDINRDTRQRDRAVEATRDAHRDTVTDQNQLRKDRAQLHRDMQNGDKAAAARDRADMQRDYREMKTDRAQTHEGMKHVRKAQRDINQDKKH